MFDLYSKYSHQNQFVPISKNESQTMATSFFYFWNSIWAFVVCVDNKRYDIVGGVFKMLIKLISSNWKVTLELKNKSNHHFFYVGPIDMARVVPPFHVQCELLPTAVRL